MVYQKLPENLKEIVEEHMNAYRIGQHGRIFFFIIICSMKIRSVRREWRCMNRSQPRFFENAKNTVRKPG